MALIDIGGVKFRPDLPYLTRTEKRLFDRLISAGKFSFFKQGYCKDCRSVVPVSKKYCSKDCYMRANGIDEDDDSLVD